MFILKKKIITLTIATIFLGTMSACTLSTHKTIATDTQQQTLKQAKAIKDNLNQAKSTDIPGKFDYYVLALSWSPSYCQSNPSDEAQCNTKTPYRFVLHGLWPNYTKGFPQFCEKKTSVNEAIAANIFPIMPSKRLITHEWTKHGTCSGLGQEAYFKYSAKLYHELKFPEFFYKNNVSSITAREIIEGLKKANPSLAQQDSIRVVVKGPKEKKVLDEIRVCYSKELKPMTCPFTRLTKPNTLLEIVPPKGGCVTK